MLRIQSKIENLILLKKTFIVLEDREEHGPVEMKLGIQIQDISRKKRCEC